MMAMCRLKSLLTVSSLHTVLLLFGLCSSLNSSISHWLYLTALLSVHVTEETHSFLVSSRHAAVWTVIPVDKLSMWHDSNESRGFVPLLAQKHYIEHLSNSSYRFIKENYIAIIIVIELSPSPSAHYCWKIQSLLSSQISVYTKAQIPKQGHICRFNFFC